MESKVYFFLRKKISTISSYQSTYTFIKKSKANENIYNDLCCYKVISDQSYSLFVFPHQLKSVLVDLFQTDAGLTCWRLRCITRWVDKKKDSNLVQQRGWG